MEPASDINLILLDKIISASAKADGVTSVLGVGLIVCQWVSASMSRDTKLGTAYLEYRPC